MIYINDNTIGVVKIPIKSPNFIQSLFGRTRDEGIKIPKKRKKLEKFRRLKKGLLRLLLNGEKIEGELLKLDLLLIYF